MGDDGVLLLQQVTVDVLRNLLRQDRVLRQLVDKRDDLSKHTA